MPRTLAPKRPRARTPHEVHTDLKRTTEHLRFNAFHNVGPDAELRREENGGRLDNARRLCDGHHSSLCDPR